MRAEWVQEAVAASQALASFDLAVSVWALLEHLVGQIPPPEGPFERIFAGHIVSRAGWEILRLQAERGLKSRHQTLDEWSRLLDIVEDGPWCEIADRLRAVEGTADSSTVAARARAFIDAHSTTPITLADVAAAARSSVRLLTDQFRRQYGLSVHEYVTRRRLATAMELLLSTDLKVSSIAESAGFRDESCLYRHFQRRLGTTPASLRTNPDAAARLAQQLSLSLSLSPQTRSPLIVEGDYTKARVNLPKMQDEMPVRTVESHCHRNCWC